jgi:molecular chaperone DnaJ
MVRICIARCPFRFRPLRSVPTLDGKAMLKIPSETQSGQVFRLKNKGIRPVRGSVTGDLYCHVQVETPVNLTSRQKELLKEFEEIRAKNASKQSPKESGFFDKVKAFFE